MKANGLVLPPVWTVPREWAGERCFILAGGESVKRQRDAIPLLSGRFIAIKQSVVLKPDADVMFIAGEYSWENCKDIIPQFKGTYIVARGKSDHRFPESTKRVTRTKDHTRLCELRDHVAGRDAGTSAINLAYHFGAKEIVLLGYDMCGGHWCAGELAHMLPHPPQEHFDRHMEHTAAFAEDARAKGIRIVNCSPISAVRCFERQPLEAFL